MATAASFAARQARVNGAVFRHLANAMATYTPVGGEAGDPVPVIFDPARAEVDQVTGTVVNRPVLDVQAASWPLLDEGGQVGIVDGASYRVRSILPLGDDDVLTVVLVKVS